MKLTKEVLPSPGSAQPIVKYSSTVWDPHTWDDIRRLEMGQRRAVLFILIIYSRYITSKLTSLKGEQSPSYVTMLYLIIHHQISIPSMKWLLYFFTNLWGFSQQQLQADLCTNGFSFSCHFLTRFVISDNSHDHDDSMTKYWCFLTSYTMYNEKTLPLFLLSA